MPRYFIEVAYKGTNYSGFQSQENANTIQEEVEKAFRILQKETVIMTGSSRTDAGVHALQNFFHFDFDGLINPRFLYKINAILPGDIYVKDIFSVAENTHCRFDAVSRQYEYFIYQQKNPFLKDRAFYYPFRLEIDRLHQAAEVIKEYTDFTSFSKRNTQVKTFNCVIMVSEWLTENEKLVYRVRGNRFLRGMVRALVATMLKVGTGKLSIEDFKTIIELKDCTRASFAAPPHALFLTSVSY